MSKISVYFTLLSWLFGFYYKFYGKELQIEDIPKCPKAERSIFLGKQLQVEWQKELQNAKEKSRSPSLTRSLIRIYGFKHCVYGLSAIISVSDLI